MTRRRRWVRRRVPVAAEAGASHAEADARARDAWRARLEPAGAREDAVAVTPLPLGCGGGGGGGGGAEFLALDVRARWVGDDDENASAARKNQNRPRVSRWSRDADAGGGELVALGELEWPIPAGALGRVDAVRNALGPWLAAFAPDDEGESLGDVASSRRDFAIFVAERDEDVSFAGASNDDVRARTNDDHRSSEHASPSPARESAWRLTAHAPVTLRTALPRLRVRASVRKRARRRGGRARRGRRRARHASRPARVAVARARAYRRGRRRRRVDVREPRADARAARARTRRRQEAPERRARRRVPSLDRRRAKVRTSFRRRKRRRVARGVDDGVDAVGDEARGFDGASRGDVRTRLRDARRVRAGAAHGGHPSADGGGQRVRVRDGVRRGAAERRVGVGFRRRRIADARARRVGRDDRVAPPRTPEDEGRRHRRHRPPDLRRVVWIAPADDATLATLGSAAFRRVEATAGAPPTRVALAFAAPKRFRTDEEGEKEDAHEKEEEGDSSFAVEVAAVARAWAPRGVSAASPRPCVRVALVPTLSATNLSDRTLRVRFRDDWETTEARCAGAAPRAFSVDVANRCSEPRTTLAPGAGPVAVRRSAAALASAIERRRARGAGARRSRGAGKTRKTRTPTRSARRTPTISGTTRAPGPRRRGARDALEIFGGGGGDDDEGGDEGETGAVVSVAAALAAGPRGLEVELADGARVLVAVEPVGPEGCRSTCRAVTFRGCAASPTARAAQSPAARIETMPRDKTMPRGDRAPPAAPFALEVALPSASASLVDGADELALASFDRATVAWRRNLAGVGGERKKPSGKDSGDESDAEAFDPFPHGVVSALEVSLGAFQLDDQTPRSAFPVVVWHNPALGPTLRATLTAAEGFETLEKNVFSSGVVADRHRTVPSFHPAMCASLAPGGVHARVHEPFAWRLVDFARRLRLERVGSGGDARDDARPRAAGGETTSDAGWFFRLAPTTAKLSFKPAPDRRPSGACGPALASALAFLNLDRLPLSVGEFRRVSDAPVRPSDLANLLATHVKGEATGQALAALASVNHLGNVAGSLDQFGETIRGFGSQGSHSESDKNGSADRARAAERATSARAPRWRNSRAGT